MTRIVSGGPLTVPEETIPHQFYRAVERKTSKAFLQTRKSKDGPYESISYTDVGKTVTDAGHGLLSFGLEPGQKFAILSDTRYEWCVADLAILSAAGVTVTMYPTLTADQIAYLLNDSGAVGVFVSDQTQFDKVAKIASQVPTLKNVVTFENVDATSLKDRTITLVDLQKKGAQHAGRNAGALEARWKNMKPDALCTIVYTSGTTGVPKGALLTHRNFVSASAAADLQLGITRDRIVETGICMVFLPLAHCYQRLVYFMVMNVGATIAFTTPATLVPDMARVKPALIGSVPRLYERMYDQILANVSQQSPGKQKIFARAADVAREYGKAVNDGGQPGFGLRLKHGLFDRLVYGKLRERLGATDLKLVITGAAAIRPDLLFFFRGIGMPILEGYGLTETSAPSNVNPPARFKVGTVGPPFPGMEMKLDTDGEILMKGPNIFLGYYNLPKETAEAFSEDGWFRTGDIGTFDGDGYLKIVDRKKELEVLSTGKKVAPVMVEEAMKTSPYIGEGLFTATDRKFGAMLLQPKMDALVKWADDHKIPYDKSKVQRVKDPTGAEIVGSVGEDLLANAEVQKLYAGEVERINKTLADFERVKAFRLIPRLLTNPALPIPLPPGHDDYEMTPTLKKKRRVIMKNFGKLVEEMFAGSK